MIYGLVEKTGKKQENIYIYSILIIGINNKNKNNDGKYSRRTYYFRMATLDKQKFYFLMNTELTPLN